MMVFMFSSLKVDHPLRQALVDVARGWSQSRRAAGDAHHPFA